MDFEVLWLFVKPVGKMPNSAVAICHHLPCFHTFVVMMMRIVFS